MKRIFASFSGLLLSGTATWVEAADSGQAAVQTGPSAGLVNDWLREQSPSGQAWDIGGNVRVRLDVYNNIGSSPDSQPDQDFIRNGKNDDTIAFFREKMHVGFRQDWFNIFLETRDSSTVGDDRDPNPFQDRFELHQAFLNIGNPAQFPVSLKVGRQQMSYGDERFVEKGDWNNLERTFDAVKLRYESSFFWVDAFVSHYVLPESGEFNEDNWHDVFSGVYASTRKLVPKVETDLYFFARNVDNTSPTVINTSGAGPTAKDIYTVGVRAKSLAGEFNGWDFGTEIAGQFGNFKQGAVRREHQAYMVDALAGYTWTNAFGKPRIGLDFTYASGDSDANDNKHETFEPLFGAAHKFYGIMDVTGLRNMISPSVNFTLQPFKGLTLRSDYFLFWLANSHDLTYGEAGKGRSLNGYAANPMFGSFFGSEIDLVASYAVAPFLNLQAGYGHFFVGDYIKNAVNSVPSNGGAVDGNFVYVMAAFRF